jgi:hypothetical protein
MTTEERLENMMNDNQPFWQTGFGRFIRWLVFLPIGCVLVAILQALPPLAVRLASGYKPEFSCLVLLLAIVAAGMLIPICSMWFMGVWMTPYLSCRLIAPNHKVGSVIFGTLFCLFQGIFILTLFGGDYSWVEILYQILFTAIVIGGTVAAYKDSDKDL